MKQSDKSKQLKQPVALAEVTNERQRRPKLKPVDKQKYKPKQVYKGMDDDEDDNIDIFAYLDDEDDEDY
jgi:hypothetical protein